MKPQCTSAWGCAPSSASSIRQSSCLCTASTFRVLVVLQGPAGTPRWGFVACQKVCPGKGKYNSEVVLNYEHRLPGALTMCVVSEVLWAGVLATAQLPTSFPHPSCLPSPHLGGKASHYTTCFPPIHLHPSLLHWRRPTPQTCLSTFWRLCTGSL